MTQTLYAERHQRTFTSRRDRIPQKRVRLQCLSAVDPNPKSKTHTKLRKALGNHISGCVWVAEVAAGCPYLFLPIHSKPAKLLRFLKIPGNSKPVTHPIFSFQKRYKLKDFGRQGTFPMLTIIPLGEHEPGLRIVVILYATLGRCRSQPVFQRMIN